MRMFFFISLTAVLLASAPVMASGPDFLLRRLADDKGRVPSALQMPELKVDFSGPKAGLGPLLMRLANEDPVFGEAYRSFLRYLDELNDRIHAAGGGRWRQQSAMRGAGEFARAIELLGGAAKVSVKANDLGVDCAVLFDEACRRADEAIEGSELALGEDRPRIVSLLALGCVAAAANRVMPADYLEEWKTRHPEWTTPPVEPPEGIPAFIWKGVGLVVPWMYHSGAMPWIDATANPHDAYDVYHFFSHAWMLRFNLYRSRYYRSGWFKKSFEENELGRMAIRKNLAYADSIGFGYEAMTVVEKSGFIDWTDTEDLPRPLKKLCTFLHIGGLPVVEAVRDLQINHAGAVFGAAMAIAGRPLVATNRAGHRAVLDAYYGGDPMPEME